MTVEQRTEPREPIALPVRFADGRVGVTRDISHSGIYVKLFGLESINSHILLGFNFSHANMRCTADADIVRVESMDGYTGIALHLGSLHLSPLPDERE